jgi:hypothetical protein
MRIAAFAAASALALAAASSAAAQDYGNIVGMISAGADTFGQGVGQGVTGQDSVFVYAQGAAKISGQTIPEGDLYVVMVQTEAATAVEAARLRDAQIDRLRAAATRFGATVDVSDASFNLGEGGMGRYGAIPVVAAGEDGDKDQKPEPAKFTAKATVKVTQPTAAKAPPMLDAMRAAGAESIAADSQANNLLLRRATDMLGMSETAKVEPAVWTAANEDAMKKAREQARQLASAGGRELGAARQITYLSRSSDGQQAMVTVAVRYALLPLH